MKREEIESWFNALAERINRLPARFGPNADVRYFLEGPAREWSIEAETALASVFPESHPTRKAWARVLEQTASHDIGNVTEKLIGIFAAASTLVTENRLGSLIDAIHMESESDLLDQANVLVEANHCIAAAVIAGGALETHLRHYVTKHAFAFKGNGSISAYNDAVASARKKAQGLYSTGDVKSVTAWGDCRNLAAHTPLDFKVTKDEVRLMIEGIRQFIARAT
jgi:hypothetical protein